MSGDGVSAVVVNYNGGDEALECVASLLDQADEVIVVDNGSHDGSPQALERAFGARITLKRLPVNVGIARGRNQGAQLAQKPLLLLVDNDAVAFPGMAAAMRCVIESDETIGIVGPIILDALDPSIVQMSAPTIDRWGFGRDPSTGTRAAEIARESVRETFYLAGTAMMVRSETLRAIGGYDPGIFFGCEDVDFCWRAWLAGYRVVSIGAATCKHRGGGSLPAKLSGSLYTPQLRAGHYRQSAERITVREANTFRMMVANLGAANLALYLALFLPVVVLESVALALLGRWGICAAYLAAFRQMLTALPSTLRRRRAVQAIRRVPDRAILRLWSRRYEKLAFLRINGIPRLLQGHPVERTQ